MIRQRLTNLLIFTACLAPLSAAAAVPKRVMALRSAQTITADSITYNGGPIMPGRVNVYLIWYGSFPSFSQTQSLVDYFVSNWGASHSYAVLHSYTDNSGNRVAPELALAGDVTDSGSRGLSILDTDIPLIVNSHVPNPFPSDTNGIYVVIIGQNVTLWDSADPAGLCQAIGYCGYHGVEASSNLKYAVVGGGDCATSTKCGLPSYPNGNVYAEATVNVLAHEIAETVTDPNLNAWGTPTTEVGDLCNNDFHETHKAPNGIAATAQVGAKYFTIQTLYSITNGGGCYSGYSPPAAIIWQNGPGGAIGAWKMQDQNTISSYLSYSNIPTGQNVLAVGDFSNTNNPQVLTIGSGNIGPVTMWTLTGSGAASAASFSTQTFLEWDAMDNQIVSTRDFNGDGYGDILAVNPSPSSGGVWLYFMQGTTVLGAQYIGNYYPWLPQGAADFNGDGLADIFWVDAVDHDYGVWTTASVAAASVTFTIWPFQSYTSSLSLLGAIDLNGDARADVAYYPRSSDGSWFIDAITFTSNPMGFVGVTETPGGAFPTSWAGFADVNRDGSADLYAQTPTGLRFFTTGTWKDGNFGSQHFKVTDYSSSTTFSDSGWTVVGTGAFQEHF